MGREGKGRKRRGRQGRGREGKGRHPPIFYCTPSLFSRNMPALSRVSPVQLIVRDGSPGG